MHFQKVWWPWVVMTTRGDTAARGGDAVSTSVLEDKTSILMDEHYESQEEPHAIC